MLSSKLQRDLIEAYQKVYEEKRGHAAGASDVEKQASQLASDVRYKSKGKVKPGASDEEKKKVFLQILGASPAPNAVKAMARQKLIGEEIEVKEGMGQEMFDKNKISGAGKKIEKKQVELPKLKITDNPDFKKPEKKVTEEMSPKEVLARKMKEKKINKLIKKDAKQNVKTEKEIASTMMGEGSAYGITKGDGMSFPERLKAKAKKKKEKMSEDAKMGRMSDDDLGKAHKKFSGMDQSTPSNKFMLKRIEKEQKKRKKVTEAKVDMKLPDYKRATARDKRYGNPYGSLELGGGIRKDRRSDHEARRGVKKEEVVNEMSGMKVKQVVKPKPPKNEKDMSKEPGQKAPVDYRTLAQSHVPVGNIFNEKKMDPVGQEDGDINNDGKKDGTDKYLMNRRKAIGKAIAKKRGKVKEGFSAWRIDLDFNEQVKK